MTEEFDRQDYFYRHMDGQMVKMSQAETSICHFYNFAVHVSEGEKKWVNNICLRNCMPTNQVIRCYLKVLALKWYTYQN